MCDYDDGDDNEDDDDDFGGNQHNTLYTEQLVKDARMWSRITNKKLEENAQTRKREWTKMYSASERIWTEYQLTVDFNVCG